LISDANELEMHDQETIFRRVKIAERLFNEVINENPDDEVAVLSMMTVAGIHKNRKMWKKYFKRFDILTKTVNKGQISHIIFVNDFLANQLLSITNLQKQLEKIPLKKNQENR